jgi:hypothetical protein
MGSGWVNKFMTMGRPRLSAASKSFQQSIKILEILEQNKDGLTALQIANQLGDRIQSGVLSRLQRAGKIKQKKAILAKGIGVIYVLNTKK